MVHHELAKLVPDCRKLSDLAIPDWEDQASLDVWHADRGRLHSHCRTSWPDYGEMLVQLLIRVARMAPQSWWRVRRADTLHRIYQHRSTPRPLALHPSFSILCSPILILTLHSMTPPASHTLLFTACTLSTHEPSPSYRLIPPRPQPVLPSLPLPIVTSVLRRTDLPLHGHALPIQRQEATSPCAGKGWPGTGDSGKPPVRESRVLTQSRWCCTGPRT